MAKTPQPTRWGYVVDRSAGSMLDVTVTTTTGDVEPKTAAA